MAKRKTRAVEENFEEITLSSGIRVRVTAFPVYLHRKIERKIEDEFEIPDPPLKTVKTVDGEETVEDPNNPDYLAEVEQIKRQRNNRKAELLGEAVCDLSVEVVTDEDEVEQIIRRVEKYTQPFPQDPNDRRVEFLTSFAIKTTDDYQALITTSINLMVRTQVTTKEEVDKEIESFPGDLEGIETPETNSPGVTEG